MTIPLSRRAWLLLAVCATGRVRAANAPIEVVRELPGAALVGSGTLRWMGLRVYDARLWADTALTPETWVTRPFVLELQYARSLSGRRIAERSLVEMRRQRDLAPEDSERWLEALQQLFPDVKAGDRISGVHRPGHSVRFHVNGQLAGELLDADFARLFFGVWLSPRTSEPTLRDALLGRLGNP